MDADGGEDLDLEMGDDFASNRVPYIILTKIDETETARYTNVG